MCPQEQKQGQEYKQGQEQKRVQEQQEPWVDTLESVDCRMARGKLAAGRQETATSRNGGRMCNLGLVLAMM